MASYYLIQGLLVLLTIHEASIEAQNITANHSLIEGCLDHLYNAKIDFASLLVDIPDWVETTVSFNEKCGIYLNTTKCLKPLLLTAPISAYPDFRGLKDALNFICIRENREEVVLYQVCYSDPTVREALELCRNWKNATEKLLKKGPIHDQNDSTCLIDTVYQDCISATLKSFSVCKNESSLLQYYWRSKLKYYQLNNTNCFEKKKAEDPYDNSEWSIILGVVLAVTIILFIIGIIMFVSFLYWRKKYNAEDAGEEGSRGVLRILGPRREVPPPYALVVPTQAVEGGEGGDVVDGGLDRERESGGGDVVVVGENGGVGVGDNGRSGERIRRPRTTLRLVDCEDRRVAERVGRFYNGDTTNTTGNGLILPPPYPEGDDDGGWEKNGDGEGEDWGKEEGGKLKGKRNYRVFVYNNDNANMDDDNQNNENIYVNNTTSNNNNNTTSNNNNNNNSSSNDLSTERTESYITVSWGSDDSSSGGGGGNGGGSGSGGNGAVGSSGGGSGEGGSGSGEVTTSSGEVTTSSGEVTTSSAEASSISKGKIDTFPDNSGSSSNSFITDDTTTLSTTTLSSSNKRSRKNKSNDNMIALSDIVSPYSTTPLLPHKNETPPKSKSPNRTTSKAQNPTTPLSSDPNIPQKQPSPHSTILLKKSTLSTLNPNTTPHSTTTSLPQSTPLTSSSALDLHKPNPLTLTSNNIHEIPHNLENPASNLEDTSNNNDIKSNHFESISQNLKNSPSNDDGNGSNDTEVSLREHSMTPALINSDLPVSLDSPESSKLPALPNIPVLSNSPVISDKSTEVNRPSISNPGTQITSDSNQEPDINKGDDISKTGVLRSKRNAGVKSNTGSESNQGDIGDTANIDNPGNLGDAGNPGIAGNQGNTGTNESCDLGEVSFKDKKNFFNRLSHGNNNNNNNNNNSNGNTKNAEKSSNNNNNKNNKDDLEKSGSRFDEFAVV